MPEFRQQVTLRPWALAHARQPPAEPAPWRGAPTGSIHRYTTADGAKRYRISYRAPDSTQRTVRGFRTKYDAEIRLAKLELSKARGEYVDPASAVVTVGTPGPVWLAQREGVLKPSSYRPLASAWAKHVRSAVGRASDRLDPALRGAFVGVGAQGRIDDRPPRAGILAGILDGAVADRRLARNVARG